MIIAGSAAVGAVVGGWGAARATDLWERTTHWETQRRDKLKRKNGEVRFTEWQVIGTFSVKETVSREGA